MKKLLIVSFVIVLALSSLSFAQLKDNVWQLSVPTRYATVRNAVTGNALQGWTGGMTVEKFLEDSNFSFGANFSFYRSEQDVFQLTFDGATFEKRQSISSSILFLTAKYSNRTSEVWVPYIGLGLGINSATKDYSIRNISNPDNPHSADGGRESFSSFALAMPIGLNSYFSDSIFLGASATPVYSAETFADSKLNWAFSLVLGFQIDQ